MMTTIRARISGSLLSLVIAVIAVGVSGCSAPNNVSDHRLNFPIGVVEETVSMAIAAPEGGDLFGPAEEVMFSKFIREYHLRSDSPIGVAVNKVTLDPAEASAHVQAIRGLLRDAGVLDSDVLVLPGGIEPEATAVLSYTTKVAVLPECENWSSRMSYNWTNSQHSNFGCATQRNLGLMIANPGDLEGADAMDNFDGQRGATIIRSYRSGEAIGGDGAAAAE
jgi:pilus assembly protein CpaD